MRTIMALHAHPDDESSKGAGTIARYVDEGVRAVLVTATGGEAGDVLNPAIDAEEILPRLAEVRREELATAAKIIGYDEVILLGYRDSGMPDTDDNRNPAAFVNAASEEVERLLVGLVREHRPDVLLGYDEHERYPHPDHIRIHDLSVRVFEAAADPDMHRGTGEAHAVSRLYAPIFSIRRARALHEAAIDAGIESPFAQRLAEMDPHLDDGKILAHIDCSETIERAREALRAHRSQVDPDGRWFALSADLVRAAYPFEDFEVLASRVPIDSSHDDLFAGI